MVSPLPPVCLLPVLAPLSIRNPDDWCGGALFFSYSPPHVICTSFFSGLLLQIRAPSISLDSIRPAYKAIGLDDILAKPCSILPSVGGSVLGALFSSKAAYSWMIPGSSCGVYITSINLVSIPCNNAALELASWCLLSSLTEGYFGQFSNSPQCCCLHLKLCRRGLLFVHKHSYQCSLNLLGTPVEYEFTDPAESSAHVEKKGAQKRLFDGQSIHEQNQSRSIDPPRQGSRQSVVSVQTAEKDKATEERHSDNSLDGRQTR